MTETELPRVLLVDDELNLIEGMIRGLRRTYSITSAAGGQAAIDILRREPAFMVIVSDLRMPGMDGIAFLKHARQITPGAVRVLFTGNADLSDAIEAVNEGAIFRFMTKPCPVPSVKLAVDAAIEQHRLITAERVLLEQTLQGSVKALTDVLALVSPAAFGRGARARQGVQDLFTRCGVAERWPVEVAAMLSQIGCVTLPLEVLEKLYHGQSIAPDEQAMIDRAPAVTEQLLGNIPRLDPVRKILLYQNKHYDGEGCPRDGVRGEDIPWGARALKAVLDLDALESQDVSTEAALDLMGGRAGWYDAVILKAIRDLRGGGARGTEMKEIFLREVRPGMVFAEDVKTTRGLLLIARGQEATLSLIERIANFSPGLGVKEPIRVTIPHSPNLYVTP
ncbi:MAG TPA: HD domain-containing phosphohydrolase [Terriglobia bacterium]|nr:HD domain-containing phosphohydrolase [Terriglobia bacterium]